ncbi:hypothetical protein Y032_0050g1895 [Ancylostoma ceylanicum]|uniref:Uncharacterized protein n=1 Tax=Ancylostoma ceylanicum TaxID=53326 RepID=A0A016U9X7_9BILA|nr:hypothetical protein Y032_0050g1895 [Ancylostoma ceylanicum]
MPLAPCGRGFSNTAYRKMIALIKKGNPNWRYGRMRYQRARNHERKTKRNQVNQSPYPSLVYAVNVS